MFIASREFLKIFALVTMTADHVDVVLLNGPGLISDLIGRAAFPLFALLSGYNLAKGADAKKYLTRLFIAGLVTVPVEMWTGRPAFPLNIFFTLFSGVALAYAVKPTAKMFHELKEPWLILMMLIIIYPMLGFVSFQIFGPLMILFSYLYYRDKNRWYLAILLVTAFLLNPASMLVMFTGLFWTLFAIVLLNDRMGRRFLKPWWLFYAYYPLHQIVIFLIKNNF